MTAELAIAIVAALALGGAAGWLTAMRWGQPPAPSSLAPVDLVTLERLFSRFVDNTTHIVGGLQEDTNGLRDEVREGLEQMREAIDKVSAWAPGQELDNPAQVTRWMGESSTDRAAMRRQLQAQRRWLVALTVAVATGLPMIAVVFARVVYIITRGGA